MNSIHPGSFLLGVVMGFALLLFLALTSDRDQEEFLEKQVRIARLKKELDELNENKK